jgi:hypothetical protein
MNPDFRPAGRVHLRVDHAVVGACLAEKLRRRTDRERLDSGFVVVIPNKTWDNGCEAADFPERQPRA